MVLATLNINGTPTKVVMDANRNGFFYVIDRTNGKLLAANPYVQVNWASSIDLNTGRPVVTEVTTKARAGEPVMVQPSILGGKNWEPMSFNPQTELAYANTLNFGGNYKAVPAEYKAGEWYVGMDLTAPWNWPEGQPRGYLKAIDPLTGKAKWEAPSDIPRFSGVLSTAGGLVFSGQLTGEFEAFDADTGKKLWQFQTGSGIEGQPVTWEQDGVQYVAVSVGYRRRLLAVLGRPAARFRAGRRIPLGLRCSPSSRAAWTKDEVAHGDLVQCSTLQTKIGNPCRACARRGAGCVAAGLRGGAGVDRNGPVGRSYRRSTRWQKGRALYAHHCSHCHGFNMVNPGTVAYDLRQFPHDQKSRFVSSVTNGKNGRMPQWGDLLSREEIDKLWAYVETGGSQ